jgi:hypothetical protein
LQESSQTGKVEIRAKIATHNGFGISQNINVKQSCVDLIAQYNGICSPKKDFSYYIIF